MYDGLMVDEWRVEDGGWLMVDGGCKRITTAGSLWGLWGGP
jgi:hypothetical protein